MLNIKQIEKNNLPQLFDLYKEFFEEQRSFGERYLFDFTNGSFNEIFLKEIEDNNKYIFLFYDDNKIIGFGRGYINIKTNSFFIQDFYIKPEERKKGNGTSLLKEIINKVSSVNLSVKEIELSVDLKNQKGIDFWHSVGFEEFQFKMSKKLD
jgi:GNAT superfamily N-acetyltransferase